MHHTVLLPQTFLPLRSIRLGRLILNVNEPQSDYLDPPSNGGPEVIVKPHYNYAGRESVTTGKEFGGTLAHLLSASRSRRKGILTQVTSERVTTYLLDNSGRWFQEAIRDEGTRKWIETANRQHGDIYLVAGYHTVLEAKVFEGGLTEKTNAGSITLPIAEAVTAGTGVLVPFGEVIDPSTEISRSTSQHGGQSFTAEGEQICAVQYRKLKFKWYSSRELHGGVPLGPNQWKTYWTFRGQKDDVVEVELQEDLELNAEEDGDDMVSYEIEGEKFMDCPATGI